MKVKVLCLLVLFSAANYASTQPVLAKRKETINYSYLLYKNAELIFRGEQSVIAGEPFYSSYESAAGDDKTTFDINFIVNAERNGFLYSNLNFNYGCSELGELPAQGTPAYKRLRFHTPLFMKSGERRIIRLNDGRYTLAVSAQINSD